MKGKFAFTGVFTALYITGTVLSLSCSKHDIYIVKDGTSTAVITIPENATEHVLYAANLLADYVEKSTGAKIPVFMGNPDEEKIIVHVGEDTYVRSLALDIKSLDGDGYVISVPDRNNIVIVGPTDWGTEFGVCEFLERYAGVRWLMPGAYGEDVPHHRTLAIPVSMVREEPAYFSRQLSSPNGLTWARRNRHRRRVEFHHNLLRLFPANKYTKTHPKFFPIWDGKRYLPENDSDHRWQPCFSAEGIVDEAVKNIKEYFKTHPEATSYSLGMNDSDHFCQCENCLAKEDPGKNFLGYRNYSDIYFEWANAVVEGVLEEHPDKWFGTLAYWNLAQPPKKIKVHPRIIPYMTYGRIRWFDPEIEAEGHRLTEWWKSMCPTLGWYDYIYGTPYMLPRVFFHQMADYLRYGYEAGVRVSYAEIYYNWGEGPKEYLALKLQWNPYLDVDAVLRDWYERAVGKAAAPELEAYYAHWEHFWTERIRQSSWYSREGQWMRFNSPGYFDIVTEQDISQSRKWLETAVTKAETKPQKERAGLLLKAFEYYEASALSFIDEMRAFETSPSSEDEALDLLNSAERYVSMKEKRWKLVDEFESDPVLRMPLNPRRYRLTMGDFWGCYPLWAAYEWAKKSGGNVRKRVDELTSSPVETVRSHAVLMRDILDGTTAPISKNSSFDKNLDEWNIRKSDQGTVTRIDTEGHNAAGAFYVTGFNHCFCEQKVPLHNRNKEYTCLGFVKVMGTHISKGNVQLTLSVVDSRGKDFEVNAWRGLADWRMTSLNPEPGSWTPVATTVDISEMKTEKRPEFLIVQLSLEGFENGTQVFIDDLGVYTHDR